MFQHVFRKVQLAFDIWFNEDIIAQTFSSYIQFDCEGYPLSDTFYKIEIELLVFK